MSEDVTKLIAEIERYKAIVDVLLNENAWLKQQLSQPGTPAGKNSSVSSLIATHSGKDSSYSSLTGIQSGNNSFVYSLSDTHSGNNSSASSLAAIH